MVDRIQGIIKWYNNVKGFGVVQGDDHKDYFLHHSNLPDDSIRLSEGMRLTFKSQPRPKNKEGYEAIDVKVLPRKEKPISSSDINQKHGLPVNQPRPSQSKPKIDDYWYQSYSRDTSQPSSTMDERILEVKVVGVTYEGRQAVVAMLSLDEEVFLVREPQNIHDRNAIMVIRTNGQQIGYLNRHLAAQLAGKFDHYGKTVKAVVSEITGGFHFGSILGVCIRFTVPDTQNN